MRAFKNTQIDVFLNAFGQEIQTSTGSTFTGIVEVLPVSIDTGGGGFIESTETHISIKNSDSTGIVINSVLTIDSIPYVVYNIVDDLSGIVDLYVRTESSQSFAEDY